MSIDDEVILELNNIVKYFKTSKEEIINNYKMHYANVLKYNPNVDDVDDVKYIALKHTINDYKLEERYKNETKH